MTKRLNVIENTTACEAKPKSIVIPIVLGLACAGALFWAINHIAGGCVDIHDVFTYCQLHTTN